MRHLAAFATGTLLSALAAGLLGSLGQPSPLPHLTRQPWHDYLALAGAPGISPWSVALIAAPVYAVCIFVAGLRSRRHVTEEAQPWSS